MTDSDFNLIHAMENVHNIPSLTPAKEREERKRRQKPTQKQQQEAGEKPLNETPGEQADGKKDDRHLIDYQA